MKIKEKSIVFENFLRKFDQKWYEIKIIRGNKGEFYTFKGELFRYFVHSVEMSVKASFNAVFMQNVDQLSVNKILKHGRKV